MSNSRAEYSPRASQASPERIHPETTLPEAWAGFIATLGPWEWFATFTFRDPTHPERADKLFRLLVSQGNRDLYGPRWFRKEKGITWVRGLEYQRRDVVHYHAILKGVGGLRRMNWVDWWYARAGIARIEAVSCQEAVRRYISKYTIKGGEIDMEGPGIPYRRLTRVPRARTSVSWPLSPLGRGEAQERVREATSAQELAALLSWARGQGSHRAVAPLITRLRDELGSASPKPTDITGQVKLLFAEARRMGHRR